MERRSLVLDPSKESVAADVLRSLEEIAGPSLSGFLHPPRGQVALEGHDVELHRVAQKTHGVGIDVDLVTEHLLELQQRLSKRLARTLLATLTPEESRQLRARDGARRPARQVAQERKRLSAQGAASPVARLAQLS